MHIYRLSTLRTLFVTMATSGALLASGCADTRAPGFFAPPPESSRTDNDFIAQGGTGRTMTTRAPSQIQIGINRTAVATPNQAATGPAAASGEAPLPITSPVPNEDTSAPPLPAGGANARINETAAVAAPATDHTAQRAFLPQAQTFVGTFPCLLAPGAQCDAQRVSLTLGPNGRWRSRTTFLSQGQETLAPQLAQGCWNVTGANQARLLLLDAQGNSSAELVASANNVLTVRSYRGRTPTLASTLTRQPDLDPINALDNQPQPTCE